MHVLVACAVTVHLQTAEVASYRKCAKGFFELQHDNASVLTPFMPSHATQCDACDRGFFQPASVPGVFRFLKFTPTRLRSAAANCVQLSEIRFFSVVKSTSADALDHIIAPLQIIHATDPQGRRCICRSVHFFVLASAPSECG
jgi:hypothetical protein